MQASREQATGAGDTLDTAAVDTQHRLLQRHRQARYASLIEGAKADPCHTPVDPTFPEEATPSMM